MSCPTLSGAFFSGGIWCIGNEIAATLEKRSLTSRRLDNDVKKAALSFEHSNIHVARCFLRFASVDMALMRDFLGELARLPADQCAAEETALLRGSLQIRRFEDTASKPLFHHDDREVRPTPTATWCWPMQSRFCNSTMSCGRGYPRRKFKATSRWEHRTSIAAYMLPSILATFKEPFPRIQGSKDPSQITLCSFHPGPAPNE